jgi:hypothetical protein
MQRASDIPPILWSWMGSHLILVWGDYALRSLCTSSLVRHKAKAHHVRSSHGQYQLLVFQPSSNALENDLFGGQPVLCFDANSCDTSVQDVIRRLVHIQSPTRVWALNPHVELPPSIGHVQITTCNEGEAPRGLEHIVGSGSGLLKLLHDTNTLRLDKKDENFDFSFLQEGFGSSDEL